MSAPTETSVPGGEPEVGATGGLEAADTAGPAVVPEEQVYTVTGGDWESVGAEGIGEDHRITVNMGPQHPSTHGVLRLVLELEGETVIRAEPVIGYLHTGIEKSCEFRNWTQGVTFVTRMDYLSPMFNEATYVLGVERLLGVEAPPRAQTIRVLMMELNRIASHLVWIATTGLELGAMSLMLYGWRERELILDVFEHVTGLRMNHAYLRPGGVSQDLPPGTERLIREFLAIMPGKVDEYESLLSANPIWIRRTREVGVLDTTGCIALGVTGPVLRSSGLPWDLRKQMPYLGYESYDFDVPTRTEGDVYARYEVRMDEIRESLKIIAQALDRL